MEELPRFSDEILPGSADSGSDVPGPVVDGALLLWIFAGEDILRFGSGDADLAKLGDGDPRL
jgi:hypothetical protein